MVNIKLKIDGTEVAFTAKKEVSISIKNGEGNVEVAKPKKEKPKSVVANTKEELLAYIKEHDTTKGVKIGKDLKNLDYLFKDFKDKPQGFFKGMMTWNMSHVESMVCLAADCENFALPIQSLRVRSSCNFTDFISGTNVHPEFVKKFYAKIADLKAKHNDETEMFNIGKPKAGTKLVAAKKEPMNAVIKKSDIEEACDTEAPDEVEG